ncbi:response regulator [Cohnella sp. GCM10027633]|uniref:response regulator transcription factor n=1 Tax=unclassified Cohnella TaxID=2636738 RepID=UPI003626742A
MKILVVDDEPNVSTGIKDFLLDSDLEVTHVETALNGFEAIDYLRMDAFDLVLTDIQMGRMSGIELMETIRMEQPELPFVVISAHEKFDFAAKSLRLGAHDYMVKPVERDDLLRVVRQVLRQKEEHGKQSLARIEKAESMSVNEMLQELVTDRNLTRQDYEQLAADLGDRFRGRSFGVLSSRLNLRSGGFSDKEVSLPDRKLLKYASVNILEESLSEWNGLTFNGYGNELVSIIQLQDPEADGPSYPLKSQLQLIGQMIHMNLKQYLNVDATVGISTLHSDVFMLPKLMEEANTAAEWKNLNPNHKVLYYEDAIRYENADVVEWIGTVDRFVQTLKSKLEDGSEVDTRDVVQPLTEMAATEELFNSRFGMLVYRIYALLLEFGHSGGVSLHRFDPDQYFRGLSADVKPNRLDAYIQEAAQAMQTMVRDRERTIIARIVGYIRENYRNPALKIQDIADEVHFSTTYLSYLFKREMKKNVWDFVTELRIDAAKQLLATTDKKRYEISYEIGYESPEHFGRMFKRYAGVSPAEYRKDNGRGAG